ncbi:MAG: hypothetical protein M3Z66_05810 [Chloroflexota bacterium]|nr:hypothetical protein [Chloroflexota bacterium]
MFPWFRSHTSVAVALLIPIPVILSLIFLVNYAPRDWSLHWRQSSVVVKSSSNNTMASVNTPQGYAILWTNPAGGLILSQYGRDDVRIAADVPLLGSPQSLALGRTGTTLVAAWREDFNGGSSLRAAIVRPGRRPLYRTLVTGIWPLEHPDAFTDGRDVGIVFSWQRSGVYNVFLSRVGVGRPAPPVQLTNVGVYAYNPHAAVDSTGTIHLVFMNACCGGGFFRLVHERFSPEGRRIGVQSSLDEIPLGGPGQSAAPDTWGLDVRRDGSRIWIAWAGGSGLTVAAFDSRNHLVVPPTDVLPLGTSMNLTFATAGNERVLVWEQTYDLGIYLAAERIGANGKPLGPPDRVSFESGFVALPLTVSGAGQPAIVYQANPAKSDVSRIQVSRFSPKPLSPPSVWARLGLGLANPLGNLVVVFLGAIALGLLITVANFVIIGVLFLAYLVISWLIRTGWKWYLYAGILAVALYLLLVQPGAQSPPLLFLTVLPHTLGLLAVAGMAIFVVFLARAILWRMDDFYRAVLMAFVAIYFFAFLEALTIVQGTVSKI